MTNHLAKEASPYLKMHSENPVDWYPWGEDALEKARSEDKPILLSIGYTACHWCHVMAHESFEDQETAQLMNEYFVNIKVDREERPDLDKIYQLSAQLLTRQVGGWPLTVFLMPTNHLPFFAGTYFPKVRRGNFPSFKEVLQYAQVIYHQHKQELQQQNVSFQNILKELESQAKITASDINPLPLQNAKQLLEEGYDTTNGGFGTAPKFPMATALELLLLYASAEDKNSKEKLLFTLQKMFHSGLYDQIGGGFFRYTVDEKWQIPHFEKMLYDNASLLALLAQTKAANMTQTPHFLDCAMRGTADWIIKEMQSPEGGYFATLAADTEGQEGKFYIWTKEQIQSALTEEEFNLVCPYFGLDKYPNFQKSWHLQVHCSKEKLAAKFNRSLEEIDQILTSASKKLYSLRANRVSPERDEKIIVSWNGLTIKGMALAGLYLKEQRYIEAAEKSVNFIRHSLFQEGKLRSVYKDGTTHQLGNLDDYVFLIEGIFYLLQSKWNNEHYAFLKELVAIVLADFQDKEAGGFYFTSNEHETLIYRLKQYTDESVPSSNAIFTKLLMYLGYFQGEETLLIAAENSLKNAYPHIKNSPDHYCSFLIALMLFYNTPHICFIRGEGESLENWREIFHSNNTPNSVGFFIEKNESLPPPLDIKKPEDSIVAYLCKGNECMAPIKNPKDFENGLQSIQFRITR